MAIVGKTDREQVLRDVAAAIEVAKEGGKVASSAFASAARSRGRRRAVFRA